MPISVYEGLLIVSNILISEFSLQHNHNSLEATQHFDIFQPKQNHVILLAYETGLVHL